jgi:hypothetical protein
MTKCFLVVATGNVRTEQCNCGVPDCKAIREVYEYRRLDTGATLFGWWTDFGSGAMHFEDAYAPEGKSYDWDNDNGKHLCVVTPGGTWDIDSRASNCTLKEDRTHRCWIRHGDVPEITVDKNGVTCQAGAGSILAGDYHGFLQNGFLT